MWPLRVPNPLKATRSRFWSMDNVNSNSRRHLFLRLLFTSSERDQSQELLPLTLRKREEVVTNSHDYINKVLRCVIIMYFNFFPIFYFSLSIIMSKEKFPSCLVEETEDLRT